MIIIIIGSKRNKETFFKRFSFFKYVVYISKINILYLILSFISLINFCIEYNGICSTIRSDFFAQYFYIIFNFIDGLLIFCSNFLLFLFSINRFLSIGSKLTNFSRIIVNASPKKMLITIFIFGCLINFAKIFEYKINDQDYNSIFTSAVYEYPIKENGLKWKLITFFDYSRILITVDYINNFISLFLNLIIDILLTIKIALLMIM